MGDETVRCLATCLPGPPLSGTHSGPLVWVARLSLRDCWFCRCRCILLQRLSRRDIGCWPRSSSHSRGRGVTQARCAMSWQIVRVGFRPSISSLIRASGASICSNIRYMPDSSSSIRSPAIEASINSSHSCYLYRQRTLTLEVPGFLAKESWCRLRRQLRAGVHVG